MYGSADLGRPNAFTTLDSEQYKQRHTALSNALWSDSPLQKIWESRFDRLVDLFTRDLREHAAINSSVCVSDEVADFAVYTVSMIPFTDKFGCVKIQQDEKDILGNWRKGPYFFGFAGRFRFFKEHTVKLPVVGLWFLPSVSNDTSECAKPVLRSQRAWNRVGKIRGQ